MSNIPPYQMGSPDGGAPPPKKSSTNVALWVIVGLVGMCAICGVIGAAVMVPVFAQARQKAKTMRQRQATNPSSDPTLEGSRLATKDLNLAMILYAADSDDIYPPFKSSEEVTKKIKRYAKNQHALDDPSAFVWNTDISGLSMTAITNVNEVWVLHTTEKDFEGKFDTGFSDGHCKWFLPDAFEKMKVKSAEIMKESNPH
jgi:hypothetical protein